MTYNFDRVIDRKGSFSLKWDGGEFVKARGITSRFDDDTIPAFTADMDFACPPAVIDALHKVVDHGIFGYTAPVHDSYYDAIIRWFDRRHGWKIEKDEITYINGTVNAVSHLLMAFTKPGDGIIIQRPIYGPFTRCINRTGRTVVNSQLIESNGHYTMDYNDLEKKAADPKNKMLILCSPHNPTGRVWTADELARLADICTRHNIIVVADEIHGDLTRVGVNFIPLAKVASKNCKLITCTAVNKTFNLAGLHCTNLVIQNRELMQQFQDYMGQSPLSASATPFAIHALIAAYNESEQWLDELREYLDGNIDWVLDFLAEKMPKVKCRRPEGTYILWMDFGGYGISAEEIHTRIYNRANVVLEGGYMFDPDRGDGFERICIPARRALIEEIFGRICDAFSDLA